MKENRCFIKYIFSMILTLVCLSACFIMPTRAESPFPGESYEGYYEDLQKAQTVEGTPEKLLEAARAQERLCTKTPAYEKLKMTTGQYKRLLSAEYNNNYEETARYAPIKNEDYLISDIGEEYHAWVLARCVPGYDVPNNTVKETSGDGKAADVLVGQSHDGNEGVRTTSVMLYLHRITNGTVLFENNRTDVYYDKSSNRDFIDDNDNYVSDYVKSMVNMSAAFEGTNQVLGYTPTPFVMGYEGTTQYSNNKNSMVIAMMDEENGMPVPVTINTKNGQTGLGAFYGKIIVDNTDKESLPSSSSPNLRDCWKYDTVNGDYTTLDDIINGTGNAYKYDYGYEQYSITNPKTGESILLGTRSGLEDAMDAMNGPLRIGSVRMALDEALTQRNSSYEFMSSMYLNWTYRYVGDPNTGYMSSIKFKKDSSDLVKAGEFFSQNIQSVNGSTDLTSGGLTYNVVNHPRNRVADGKNIVRASVFNNFKVAGLELVRGQGQYNNTNKFNSIPNKIFNYYTTTNCSEDKNITTSSGNTYQACTISFDSSNGKAGYGFNSFYSLEYNDGGGYKQYYETYKNDNFGVWRQGMIPTTFASIGGLSFPFDTSEYNTVKTNTSRIEDYRKSNRYPWANGDEASFRGDYVNNKVFLEYYMSKRDPANYKLSDNSYITNTLSSNNNGDVDAIYNKMLKSFSSMIRTRPEVLDIIYTFNEKMTNGVDANKEINTDAQISGFKRRNYPAITNNITGFQKAYCKYLTAKSSAAKDTCEPGYSKTLDDKLGYICYKTDCLEGYNTQRSKITFAGDGIYKDSYAAFLDVSSKAYITSDNVQSKTTFLEDLAYVFYNYGVVTTFADEFNVGHFFFTRNGNNGREGENYHTFEAIQPAYSNTYLLNEETRLSGSVSTFGGDRTNRILNVTGNLSGNTLSSTSAESLSTTRNENGETVDDLVYLGEKYGAELFEIDKSTGQYLTNRSEFKTCPSGFTQSGTGCELTIVKPVNVSCKKGYILNPTTGRCVSAAVKEATCDIDGGNDYKSVSGKCISNYNNNEQTSDSNDATSTLFKATCKTGTVYNQATGKCTATKEAVCPTNSWLDESGNKCITTSDITGCDTEQTKVGTNKCLANMKDAEYNQDLLSCITGTLEDKEYNLTEVFTFDSVEEFTAYDSGTYFFEIVTNLGVFTGTTDLSAGDIVTINGSNSSELTISTEDAELFKQDATTATNGFSSNASSNMFSNIVGQIISIPKSEIDTTESLYKLQLVDEGYVGDYLVVVSLISSDTVDNSYFNVGATADKYYDFTRAKTFVRELIGETNTTTRKVCATSSGYDLPKIAVLGKCSSDYVASMNTATLETICTREVTDLNNPGDFNVCPFDTENSLDYNFSNGKCVHESAPLSCSANGEIPVPNGVDASTMEVALHENTDGSGWKCVAQYSPFCDNTNVAAGEQYKYEQGRCISYSGGSADEAIDKCQWGFTHDEVENNCKKTVGFTLVDRTSTDVFYEPIPLEGDELKIEIGKIYSLRNYVGYTPSAARGYHFYNEGKSYTTSLTFPQISLQMYLISDKLEPTGSDALGCRNNIKSSECTSLSGAPYTLPTIMDNSIIAGSQISKIPSRHGATYPEAPNNKCLYSLKKRTGITIMKSTEDFDDVYSAVDVVFSVLEDGIMVYHRDANGDLNLSNINERVRIPWPTFEDYTSNGILADEEKNIYDQFFIVGEDGKARLKTTDENGGLPVQSIGLVSSISSMKALKTESEIKAETGTGTRNVDESSLVDNFDPKDDSSALITGFNVTTGEIYIDRLEVVDPASGDKLLVLDAMTSDRCLNVVPDGYTDSFQNREYKEREAEGELIECHQSDVPTLAPDATLNYEVVTYTRYKNKDSSCTPDDARCDAFIKEEYLTVTHTVNKDTKSKNIANYYDSPVTLNVMEIRSKNDDGSNFKHDASLKYSISRVGNLYAQQDRVVTNDNIINYHTAYPGWYYINHKETFPMILPFKNYQSGFYIAGDTKSLEANILNGQYRVAVSSNNGSAAGGEYWQSVMFNYKLADTLDNKVELQMECQLTDDENAEYEVLDSIESGCIDASRYKGKCDLYAVISRVSGGDNTTQTTNIRAATTTEKLEDIDKVSSAYIPSSERVSASESVKVLIQKDIDKSQGMFKAKVNYKPEDNEYYPDNNLSNNVDEDCWTFYSTNYSIMSLKITGGSSISDDYIDDGNGGLKAQNATKTIEFTGTYLISKEKDTDLADGAISERRILTEFRLRDGNGNIFPCYIADNVLAKATTSTGRCNYDGSDVEPYEYNTFTAETRKKTNCFSIKCQVDFSKLKNTATIALQAGINGGKRDGAFSLETESSYSFFEEYRYDDNVTENTVKIKSLQQEDDGSTKKPQRCDPNLCRNKNEWNILFDYVYQLDGGVKSYWTNTYTKMEWVEHNVDPNPTQQSAREDMQTHINEEACEKTGEYSNGSINLKCSNALTDIGGEYYRKPVNFLAWASYSTDADNSLCTDYRTSDTGARECWRREFNVNHTVTYYLSNKAVTSVYNSIPVLGGNINAGACERQQSEEYGTLNGSGSAYYYANSTGTDGSDTTQKICHGYSANPNNKYPGFSSTYHCKTTLDWQGNYICDVGTLAIASTPNDYINPQRFATSGRGDAVAIGNKTTNVSNTTKEKRLLISNENRQGGVGNYRGVSLDENMAYLRTTDVCDLKLPTVYTYRCPSYFTYSFGEDFETTRDTDGDGLADAKCSITDSNNNSRTCRWISETTNPDREYWMLTDTEKNNTENMGRKNCYRVHRDYKCGDYHPELGFESVNSRYDNSNNNSTSGKCVWKQNALGKIIDSYTEERTNRCCTKTVCSDPVFDEDGNQIACNKYADCTGTIYIFKTEYVSGEGQSQMRYVSSCENEFPENYQYYTFYHTEECNGEVCDNMYLDCSDGDIPSNGYCYQPGREAAPQANASENWRCARWTTYEYYDIEYYTTDTPTTTWKSKTYVGGASPIMQYTCDVENTQKAYPDSFHLQHYSEELDVAAEIRTERSGGWVNVESRDIESFAPRRGEWYEIRVIVTYLTNRGNKPSELSFATSYYDNYHNHGSVPDNSLNKSENYTHFGTIFGNSEYVKDILNSSDYGYCNAKIGQPYGCEYAAEDTSGWQWSSGYQFEASSKMEPTEVQGNGGTSGNKSFTNNSNLKCYFGPDDEKRWAKYEFGNGIVGQLNLTGKNKDGEDTVVDTVLLTPTSEGCKETKNNLCTRYVSVLEMSPRLTASGELKRGYYVEPDSGYSDLKVEFIHSWIDGVGKYEQTLLGERSGDDAWSFDGNGIPDGYSNSKYFNLAENEDIKPLCDCVDFTIPAPKGAVQWATTEWEVE